MRPTRRTLCAGLAATAVIVPATAQALQPPPWSDIATIVVQNLAGEQVALGSLAGAADRPILLQFWATWCAPCLPESVHLATVRRRIPDSRMAVIGVNLDRNQSADRLNDFRERAGMNYTQALGQAGLFIVSTRETGLALPRVHLYGRDGALRDIFAGYSTERSPAIIDAAVERALAA